MEFDQLLSRLAVALGIGLLVGLERGWKTREAEPGSRAAGIRTFALSGLLGGLSAAMAQATGSAEGAGLVLGLTFAVYATIAALFERDAARAAGNYSATTVVATMLTFMLGAYAVAGDMRVASAAAVAATGILAARGSMHEWVERITWRELRSVLVLLAMTFIVLPVLPDTSIGPYGGVNPREVWLIAIVLAGVSFLGYGAARVLGVTRGVLLSALAGGLVSSTAVTLSNARRAAAGEGSPRLLAAGVAIATAVSFLRVIALLVVLKPALLLTIAPALVVAALVSAGYAILTVYWRREAKDDDAPAPTDFRNPFSFWPVVGFAVFLGAVILIGRAIGQHFGLGGAFIGAVVLGLADVDAVTVATARMVPGPLSETGASLAILGAVASNMAAKVALSFGLGGGRFAVDVAAMSAACWLAGGLALWGTLLLTAS